MDASQAQDNFTAWDLDRDGAISSAEMATGLKTIQDAKAQVAVFDKDQKGYFTLEDLKTAIAADPTSTTASAEDLMLWWDVNGDGMVTPQDVIARKNLDATQATSVA
jgi:Ca2+-binding EF-hand superfamily protein